MVLVEFVVRQNRLVESDEAVASYVTMMINVLMFVLRRKLRLSDRRLDSSVVLRQHSRVFSIDFSMVSNAEREISRMLVISNKKQTNENLCAFTCG